MRKESTTLSKLPYNALFLFLILFLNPVLLKADGGIWLNAADIPGQSAHISNSPQIAFDCAGNAFAVWTQAEPTSGSYQIYYSHFDVSTSNWSNAALFPGQPSQDAETPQIAIDCSGNAFAVWEQGNRIYYSRYDGSWSNASQFPGELNQKGETPQIAFDCSNNAFAIWSQYHPPAMRNHVWYSYYDASAGSWSNTATTFPGQPNIAGGFSPQIAFDCSGNAFAVWYQWDPSIPIHQIWYSHYSAGSWSNATKFPDQPALEGRNPQIAFDCLGNAFAVWQQRDASVGNNYQIYYSNYDAPNDNWSNTAKLPDQLSQTAQNPQIAVDCSGNAFAIWQQNYRIYYSRYDSSTDSWSNATQIPGQSEKGLNSQIAFDCSGNAFVVWENYHLLYSRYYATIGSWSNATSISGSGAQWTLNPQITFDCSGNAIVVWKRDTPEGSLNLIYYSYYDAVPAPSVSTKQEFHRFSTQGELINVLWWNPVIYLNPIAKYKIYCKPYQPQKSCCENCCNCKIMCCTCPCVGATLIGETSYTHFYHHNRFLDQRVTYCITAVDNHGNETPVPASVTIPQVS